MGSFQEGVRNQAWPGLPGVSYSHDNRPSGDKLSHLCDGYYDDLGAAVGGWRYSAGIPKGIFLNSGK